MRTCGNVSVKSCIILYSDFNYHNKGTENKNNKINITIENEETVKIRKLASN